MLIVAALGRALESPHLQVQYALLGALTAYRGMIFNLHLEAPEHAHVRLRLLTLPILAAAFYLTAKLAALRDSPEQRTIRGLFAATGSSFLGLLIWYEAPELWQPLAFIAFAVALSEAGRALRYHALAWHSHLLTALSVFTALTADQGGVHSWHTIPVRAFSALPVVIGGLLACQAPRYHRRTTSRAGAHSLHLARQQHDGLDSAGSASRALDCRRLDRFRGSAGALHALDSLSATVVAGKCRRSLCFASRVLLQLRSRTKFWGPISLRIFTISMVAAGLYFLSRRAAPEERYTRMVAFFHSFAATGLLALLAWYEAPNGWLAPLWAAFALLLAIVDQRFELEELPWQSHILAGLTLLRSISVNLYVTATWHGISVRLLSLAIVAVIFYALSRLIRMPEKMAPARHTPHLLLGRIRNRRSPTVV